MNPRRFKYIDELIADITISPRSIIVEGEKILGIELDSRNIEKNYLFAAIKGTQTDGHLFIQAAIKKGATAILCEDLPEHLEMEVSYIVVDNASQAVGILASTFFDNPSHHLKLIGVTGTNGKTTVATLIYQSLGYLDEKVGLISTVENRVGDQVITASHTTPDAVRLQELLAQMKSTGCEYVVMEVSSHAIHQRRIQGCRWAVALFTNLTHDHLDYHGTFANYRDAKKSWFDRLSKGVVAITNADDKNGTVMVQNTKATVKYYGVSGIVDYRARSISPSLQGMELNIQGTTLHVQLRGQFNIYNICATYAALRELSFQHDDILIALSRVRGPKGRMQSIHVVAEIALGIVDYAHTPDALENVLQTIRRFKHPEGRLFCVVGCGGDRDRSKRPIMAQIGKQYSDVLVITSDNPRSEDPEKIIEEMMSGFTNQSLEDVISIVDRREAITYAVEHSTQHDIVLVAGKGHEGYQEIEGIRHPFDDEQELKKALLEKAE